MRLLLVVAALLVVVKSDETAVQTKEQNEETRELKDLLTAVKHYLDEKDSKAEDIRTVYKPSTSHGDVQSALSSGKGYWTEWINVDSRPNYGTGEFEDCSRVRWQQNIDRKCYLGCEDPIAMKYALQDSSSTKWEDIEKCIGPMDNKRANECGFMCLNMEARRYDKSQCALDKCEEYGLSAGCRRCPDVRVQFFCIGDKPPVDQCCPYSDNCKQKTAGDLRASLETIKNLEERRDIIAGMLEDVRSVLEETDADNKVVKADVEKAPAKADEKAQ